MVVDRAPRINSGHVNPDDLDASLEQHLLVLQQVPYMLSVSPLDCEALDYMMGFDLPTAETTTRWWPKRWGR
ncbi:MAG: hypothetical protein CM1200mP2_23600 [Planctomycetaceae bacterium]|nr:MAG: hypothetical protein CM1200mP2_23600 [Planctomycetaceae bacterium]